MSITIWKPRQYVDGFATDQFGGYSPVYEWGVNGEVAATPFDKDSKVREITRFTGWRQEYFADTGEMEITVSAGQVLASDIQYGYMVEIDGKHYTIETIKWNLTESGYECTIGGRDFGKYLDRTYPRDLKPIEGVPYAAAYEFGDKMSVKGISDYLSDFFVSDEVTGMGVDSYGLDLYPIVAGWFRDGERRGVDWVRTAFEDESVLSEGKGSRYVGEIMNYGAQLRTFCSWFGIGYRFAFEWSEAKGLFEVVAELYNRASSGVVIKSNGRGVSGFEWERDRRSEVNGLSVQAVSKWLRGRDNGVMRWIESDDGKNMNLNVYVEDRGDARSYAEYAERLGVRFIDLGEVPDENDVSGESALDWVFSQVSQDDFIRPSERIAFDYDNKGAYKYGEHFFLGSKVAIVDDFLGIGSEQVLTGVKTTYDSGKAATYSFEFGDSRVSQADKIIKKFAQLDRKTYASRKE